MKRTLPYTNSSSVNSTGECILKKSDMRNLPNFNVIKSMNIILLAMYEFFHVFFTTSGNSNCRIVLLMKNIP